MWMAEAGLPNKCPQCGLPFPLPERVRAEGESRTAALRNLYREIFKAFVDWELDRWTGPERVEGYGRDHVHELTKMKLGQLESLSDYRPVPEARISAGRLDMAYVSRVTNEIVAAFEVDPSVKKKSLRKLGSLPGHVLKVLVSVNPRGRGFDSRVAGFRQEMDEAGILHIIVEAREAAG